jgi:hypothetical protein
MIPLHPDLVIAFGEINLGEVRQSCHLIEEGINAMNRLFVFASDFVESSVVNAQPL